MNFFMRLWILFSKVYEKSYREVIQSWDRRTNDGRKENLG